MKPAEHAVSLISIDRKRSDPPSVPLQPLAQYIEAEQIDIEALVAGVYVAEDSSEAQQHRLALQQGERIVTRDGVVYGSNWVSHAGSAAVNSGYLVREEEMQTLKAQE